MKHLALFILLLFCYDTISSGQTKEEMHSAKEFWAYYDSIETVMNLEPPMRIALPQLSAFTKFQTFDEFRMSGKGCPLSEPFVYVLKKGDEIFVKKSNDIQNTLRYVRIGDVWYNYQNMVHRKYEEPDVEKCLCIGERYNRVVVNDSIIELRCLYSYVGTNARHEPFEQYGNTALKFLYVKTPGRCVIIRLAKNDSWTPSNRINEMRKLARMQTENPRMLLSWNQRDCNKWRYIDEYELSEEKDTYILKLKDDDVDSRYVFQRTSLGLYGISPGLQNVHNFFRRYKK